MKTKVHQSKTKENRRGKKEYPSQTVENGWALTAGGIDWLRKWAQSDTNNEEGRKFLPASAYFLCRLVFKAANGLCCDKLSALTAALPPWPLSDRTLSFLLSRNTHATLAHQCRDEALFLHLAPSCSPISHLSPWITSPRRSRCTLACRCEKTQKDNTRLPDASICVNAAFPLTLCAD